MFSTQNRTAVSLPRKRTRSSLNENVDSSKTVKSGTPLKPQNGTDVKVAANSTRNRFSKTYEKELVPLYSESVIAKIWGVALKALNKREPPLLYPEYTEPSGTAYVYTAHDFWTSGFFPGSLYLLLERQRNYPAYFPLSKKSRQTSVPHPVQLQFACDWWTENLHAMASKRDTHDLGFMIQPWACKAWELNRDERSFETLQTAAKSLASRFNEKVRSLQSWDICVTRRYEFKDPEKDFLVIIDNMLNLDLLFWVASKTNDTELARIATLHAKTTQTHHIRSNATTYHVVNFDQTNGTVKQKMTNQGYSDESCWSRGQAWGILGFVQSYLWTKDRSFLDTATNLADFFLENLPDDGVPFFDFLAPDLNPKTTPRDSSAALIACYGMLLIHECKLKSSSERRYLNGALHLLKSVLKTSMAPAAAFSGEKNDLDMEVNLGKGEETIVRRATINNYEFAPRRWADHGLVYADYYFLAVGNKLLEMGLDDEVF